MFSAQEKGKKKKRNRTDHAWSLRDGGHWTSFLFINCVFLRLEADDILVDASVAPSKNPCRYTQPQCM
jgi:hypothetical protein